MQVTKSRKRVIEQEAFNGLIRLTYLDLSNNLLKFLPSYLLYTNPQLLDISENDILPSSFASSFFSKQTSLLSVYVQYEEICCIVQTSICIPDFVNTNIYTGCLQLLGPSWILVVVMIYSCLIIFFNVFCFWYVSSHNQLSVKSALECNQTVSDGLMGVYYAILLVADIVYMNDASYIMIYWKRSWLCKTASLFMMLSIEFSLSASLIISIERLITLVIYPFGNYKMSKRTAACLTVMSKILTSVVPVMSMFHSSIEITNSLCISLASLPVNFSVLYCMVHALQFTALCMIYGIVLKTVKGHSRHSDSKNHSKHIFKFGCIILTSCISYFTASILIVSAMAKIKMYSYLPILSLIILPLSSMINPVKTIIQIKTNMRTIT